METPVNHNCTLSNSINIAFLAKQCHENTVLRDLVTTATDTMKGGSKGILQEEPSVTCQVKGGPSLLKTLYACRLYKAKV